MEVPLRGVAQEEPILCRSARISLDHPEHGPDRRQPIREGHEVVSPVEAEHGKAVELVRHQVGTERGHSLSEVVVGRRLIRPGGDVARPVGGHPRVGTRPQRKATCWDRRIGDGESRRKCEAGDGERHQRGNRKPRGRINEDRPWPWERDHDVASLRFRERGCWSLEGCREPVKPPAGEGITSRRKANQFVQSSRKWRFVKNPRS
jgi:hypothetical protein